MVVRDGGMVPANACSMVGGFDVAVSRVRERKHKIGGVRRVSEQFPRHQRTEKRKCALANWFALCGYNVLGCWSGRVVLVLLSGW